MSRRKRLYQLAGAMAGVAGALFAWLYMTKLLELWAREDPSGFRGMIFATAFVLALGTKE